MSLAAQMIETQVRQDAAEPRGKAPGGVEPSALHVDVDKCLLREIFGRHRVTEVAECDVESAVPVPQVRPVEWVRRISRDDLTPGLASVVTSWLTIFAVEGWDAEVNVLLADKTPEPDETEGLHDLYPETVARADELISDILAKIGPYDFQDLVAAALRAMGLRTKVSPPGPDGGKDIVAHPDAFGFSEPVIKMQVKHTKDSMGAPDCEASVPWSASTKRASSSRPAGILPRLCVSLRRLVPL